MNILDSFSGKGEEPKKSAQRRAKKIKASGDSERREKKQNVSRISLLNGTSFTIAVRVAGFLLGLIAAVAIVYFGYLGIMIFIGD